MMTKQIRANPIPVLESDKQIQPMPGEVDLAQPFLAIQAARRKAARLTKGSNTNGVSPQANAGNRP